MKELKMTDSSEQKKENSKETIELSSLADLDQLIALVTRVVTRVQNEQKRNRLVILLEGRMGAGKTTFVSRLVESLGSSEACSPSFAIHNQYQTPEGVIDHLDLFRVQSEDELESTGFWDLFSQKDGLILIEWADLLETKLLPRTWPKLRLRFILEGDRRRVEAEYLG